MARARWGAGRKMGSSHYKSVATIRPAQYRQAPWAACPPHLADNQAMPLPPPPIRRHSNKANNELLVKGLLCVLIGLAVLVSPYFISSPGMQGIVAKASLVGWFALVLGLGFIGVYVRRRLAGRTGPSGPL